MQRGALTCPRTSSWRVYTAEQPTCAAGSVPQIKSGNCRGVADRDSCPSSCLEAHLVGAEGLCTHARKGGPLGSREQALV